MFFEVCHDTLVAGVSCWCFHDNGLPVSERSMFTEKTTLTMEHSPKRPFVINVTPQDPSKATHAPMDNLSGLEEAFGPCFELPHGVQLCPSKLTDLFLSDQLIKDVILASNEHARKTLPRSQVGVVTDEKMLRFLAICHCMGVVDLPAKVVPLQRTFFANLRQQSLTPLKP